jgi:hypothetical protein
MERRTVLTLVEVVVAKSLRSYRSIIVFPMMASMMAAVVSAVVVTRIIRGMIVSTSVVVIISVPGITMPATVVIGSVKRRNAAETDTEVLGLGLGRDQSKQP